MRAEVYWIRAQHHTNIMSDGYIGVSKNANKRWEYGHKWANIKGRHENPFFSNAISKYGWDNLIKTIIVMADEFYCYDLERKLRPTNNIGWNLVSGGGKPPVAKSRGPNYISPLKGVSRSTPWMIGRTPATAGMPVSEETRAKISALKKDKKQTLQQIKKRVESRRITMIAKGQIKPFIVNGVQYESSKIASKAVCISEATLKYWAYNNAKPSKKYPHIIECRWAS